MKIQHVAVTLTVVNLLLLIVTFTPLRPAFAPPRSEPADGVLRGRSLEIVDARGRARAQILITEPTTVEGVRYPESVLFRLIDADGQPSVKLSTSVEGSGLSLLGGPDDEGWYGLRFQADAQASLIELAQKDGRRSVIRP